MKWSRRWFADSLIGCIPMLESFSQQSLMEEKSGKTTKWDMIRHDCGKQTISTLTNRLESSSSSFCERVFIDAPSRKEKNNNKKYRWRHSIRVDCDRWRWKKKRIYEEFSWKTREFFFFCSPLDFVDKSPTEDRSGSYENVEVDETQYNSVNVQNATQKKQKSAPLFFSVLTHTHTHTHTNTH